MWFSTFTSSKVKNSEPCNVLHTRGVLNISKIFINCSVGFILAHRFKYNKYNCYYTSSKEAYNGSVSVVEGSPCEWEVLGSIPGRVIPLM